MSTTITYNEHRFTTELREGNLKDESRGIVGWQDKGNLSHLELERFVVDWG